MTHPSPLITAIEQAIAQYDLVHHVPWEPIIRNLDLYYSPMDFILEKHNYVLAPIDPVYAPQALDEIYEQVLAAATLDGEPLDCYCRQVSVYRKDGYLQISSGEYRERIGAIPIPREGIFLPHADESHYNLFSKQEIALWRQVSVHLFPNVMLAQNCIRKTHVCCEAKVSSRIFKRAIKKWEKQKARDKPLHPDWPPSPGEDFKNL